MKDTIEEKTKKIKHVKLSYNIDSFSSLIDYHESKAISNAFFIAFAIVLVMSMMEYDTIVAAAFILIMALMYRFYFWQTKRKLIKPDWEENEIDEED
ncbi:MAG: hypothetical protein ACTSR6_03975 [Candidatus Heimdallarchaeota archaeon]